MQAEIARDNQLNWNEDKGRDKPRHGDVQRRIHVMFFVSFARQIDSNIVIHPSMERVFRERPRKDADREHHKRSGTCKRMMRQIEPEEESRQTQIYNVRRPIVEFRFRHAFGPTVQCAHMCVEVRVAVYVLRPGHQGSGVTM